MVTLYYKQWARVICRVGFYRFSIYAIPVNNFHLSDLFKY